MSFFWHSPRLSLPEQTGGFFSCLSIIPHFFEKCKGFCKIFFQPHDFFYFCIWKRCWLQKMSHLFEILFPITSRRQTKSFSVQQFFKNAAEVWASSPHLRSKFNFVVWFSCCNCLRLEICSLSHKIIKIPFVLLYIVVFGKSAPVPLTPMQTMQTLLQSSLD